MIHDLKTTFCVLAFLFTPLVVEVQVGGRLVEFPPLDISLEISETADGKPVISMDSIEFDEPGKISLRFTTTYLTATSPPQYPRPTLFHRRIPSTNKQYSV